MEQPNLQQQLEAATDAQARFWYAHGLSSETEPRARALPTSELLPEALISKPPPRCNPMSANSTNTRAYTFNHGLPVTSSMVMSEIDHQGGLSNQLDFANMFGERSIVVKSDMDYNESSQWPMPLQQAVLLQPTGTARGSDLDTVTSSVSPKSSYFSERSEHAATVSPHTEYDEASVNSAWAEYSAVLPCQVKQSPSQSSSPGFHPQLQYALGGGMANRLPSSHSTNIGLGPSTGQRFDTGLGSQVAQFDLPWTASVAQDDGVGGLTWHSSIYTQQQRQSPYYNTSFVGPFRHGSHGTDNSSPKTPTRAKHPQGSHGPSREAPRDAHSQDSRSLGGSTDEQTQREAENRILIDGKAAGLTYKEIRARIGVDIAESTLRGRYRALTKARQDRVRKPTWTAKDIRLLKEVVAQQLENLDDGLRSVDANQRLSRVSWKKAGEYILEHGGSYKFGNSTCKKKWIEINQRR